MSYIKISDPSIIDLSGVQQIINVVNQHSDYLNALINRFGVIETPDWEGNSTQNVYDPATSVLAYGKETITSQMAGSTPGLKTYYSIDVDYDGVTFSQNPFIVLTLDNSQGTYNTQMDFMLSTFNVSTSGFTIRAMRAGMFGDNKLTIDNEIRVNWIAIGPR